MWPINGSNQLQHGRAKFLKPLVIFQIIGLCDLHLWPKVETGVLDQAFIPSFVEIHDKGVEIAFDLMSGIGLQVQIFHIYYMWAINSSNLSIIQHERASVFESHSSFYDLTLVAFTLGLRSKSY